jgi:hypothetical protein
MAGALPNFFIVGAPKAGSTSLYHYLDQHPDVFMSPVKEPCYFASELRLENFSEEEQPRVRREMRALDEYLRGSLTEKRFGGLVSDWESYCRLFRNVTAERAIGEASVCYLWSETAAANIRERIPDARILMVLRNPVERAFSQYLHALSVGLVCRGFREQVEANLHSSSKKFGSSYPFLEFGLYYEQVKRYLEMFPSDRVRIYLYDEYQRDAGRVVTDIFAFIGVDSSFAPAMNERHLEFRIPKYVRATQLLKRTGVWFGVRDLSPEPVRRLLRKAALRPPRALRMTPEDRAFLIDYYRDDIHQLSTLLKRDLSVWLGETQ